MATTEYPASTVQVTRPSTALEAYELLGKRCVPAWAGTALDVLHPQYYVDHIPGNLIDQDIEAAGLDPELNLGGLPS